MLMLRLLGKMSYFIEHFTPRKAHCKEQLSGIEF